MTEISPIYYRIKPDHPDAAEVSGEGRIELFRAQDETGNISNSPFLLRFSPELMDGSTKAPPEVIIEGVQESVLAIFGHFLAELDPKIIAQRLESLSGAFDWLELNLAKNTPGILEQWDHIANPALPPKLVEVCLSAQPNDIFPIAVDNSHGITRKLYVRNQDYFLHPPQVQSAILTEKKIVILVVDEIVDGNIKPAYYYFNLDDGRLIASTITD